MTDEVFRWVITAAVGLAALAFVVQAFFVGALYAGIRKLQQQVAPLVERAGPVIGDLQPMIARASTVLEKAAPMVEKAGSMIDKAAVIVEKTGPVVDQAETVLANANLVIEDTRPKVAEIADHAVEIAKASRLQVDRLGDLLNDAGDLARARLTQIDESVGNTVEQVEEIGGAMKRAVLKPVREANGLAAGLSAAVSTLVKGPRRPSVDKATQDEEMFI